MLEVHSPDCAFQRLRAERLSQDDYSPTRTL